VLSRAVGFAAGKAKDRLVVLLPDEIVNAAFAAIRTGLIDQLGFKPHRS